MYSINTYLKYACKLPLPLSLSAGRKDLHLKLKLRTYLVRSHMSINYLLFACLEVLGLSYVPYVVGFQHIVVKIIIHQVRGKKHDRAIII